MNIKQLRVVHYLNQFFGQVGQEEMADMKFLVKDGPIGPGLALQKMLGEKGKIVATVICGDNYFAEHIEEAVEEALKIITPLQPDLFFAGPAFEAGRYGIACGAICHAIKQKLRIPAITGMADENPGVDLYRRFVYICKTGKSPLKITEDFHNMLKLGLKLLSQKEGSKLVSEESINRPSEDNYYPRGVMKNEYTLKTAAERGVEMMLAKLQDLPFQTEVELPKFHTITSPSPIRKDLRDCEIALISDGGLVPKGNPHGLKGRGNLVWAAYDIASFLPEGYSSDNYEIAHTGYYPLRVLENPNRLVPADVMRGLEKKGIIGKLHPFFYSTSGNGVIQKRGQEMGEEIVAQLKKKEVDGAILTST
jgi:betaine reductase